MNHQNPDTCIVDPRPLLSDARADSPLWALADSFDAVANGMKNLEADGKLERIRLPGFEPWQNLVRAVSALYADDTEGCLEAAGRIDEASPPAALIPLFRAWADSPEALNRASAATALLYRRVVSDVHPLEILAEQAEEALRHGMFERFETTSRRVLQDLDELPRADGSLLAIRYAVRCLSLLDEAGSDDIRFMDTLTKALGKADALLAAGLALLEVDGEAAAAAFRGALECGEDGRFLRGPMRRAVAEAAKTFGAPRLQGRVPHERDALQLDLFSGVFI
ncbi:MAG: hypothetical protein A2Y36_12435 [Treponema sp. GWA1_62_8]|nr:MAG: hypothetical protein A2Y36_12435 [Treponema sp. GWA1_62_8]